MATHFFQDLIVWQKAMDLVELAYSVTDQLPKEEVYALSDQIKRSAVSIPSNIAEGQKRNNVGETVHFTAIAAGSLAELETQLLIAKRLYRVDIEEAIELCAEVGRLTTGLIKSLKQKSKI